MRKKNPHLSGRLDFVGYVTAELVDEVKAYMRQRGFTPTLTSIPKEHGATHMTEPGDRELYVTKGKGAAALKAMQRKYGG